MRTILFVGTVLFFRTCFTPDDEPRVIVGVGEARGIKNAHLARSTAANRAHSEVYGKIWDIAGRAYQIYWESPPPEVHTLPKEPDPPTPCIAGRRTWMGESQASIHITREWIDENGTYHAQAELDVTAMEAGIRSKLVPEWAQGTLVDAVRRAYDEQQR
jgi:hypothetical protein